MNSTEQTTKNSDNESPRNYKTILLEVQRLRSRAGSTAHKRAKLLCAVFNDTVFRADCGNVDDFRAADILDSYIDDLCLGFLDLKALLEYYPAKRHWREGRLHRMFQTMMAEKESATTRRPRRSSKPVAEETKKALAERLETARRELAKTRSAAISEVDQLRARIAELETENAELRTRVAELEAIIEPCVYAA